MFIEAVYSVYNEADTIAISMRSVAELVDGYHIVDGRYEGYAVNEPVLSTDRTVEIAKTFRNVRVTQLSESLPQCVKRELYCKDSKTWSVLMDGHCIAVGDLHRLRHELGYRKSVTSVDCKVYSRLKELMLGKFYWRTRLFGKGLGFHYGNHHWMRKDKAGNIVDGKGWKCDYVSFITLHELRSKQQEQWKDAYLLWRSSHQSERW